MFLVHRQYLDIHLFPKPSLKDFSNFFASPTLCLGSDWRLMMEVYQKTALLKSFAKITLLSSD